jgi:hypothetical protein
VALLTARALMRWRRGEVRPAAWVVNLCSAGLAFVGAVVAVGCLLAGGGIGAGGLGGWRLAGIEAWAVLGLLPVLGAGLGWWYARRQRRAAFLTVVAATAVLFVGALATWGGVALDAHKAPRVLARALLARQTEQDIRVACYQYYQPSLVFYCRREVTCLQGELQVQAFLRGPLPVYLFVPAPVWEGMKGKFPAALRVLGQAHDLYRRCDVVVVTNR